MATTTTKLQLVKPDYNDVRDIKVLNNNSDKIDTFAVNIEKLISDNKLLNDDSHDYLLLQTSIKGSTATITKNSDGKVSVITHKIGTTTVRTDTFTYAATTITEVRDLTGKNKKLTLVYNLVTLETVVS